VLGRMKNPSQLFSSFYSGASCLKSPRIYLSKLQTRFWGFS
jgi:hypothetical protein